MRRLFDHLQAAADMDRRGRHHLAVFDQRELGGAAADVDVEDALARSRDTRAAPEPKAASIASM